MIKYPKIESLFNRDEKSHKFIEGEYRLPEFEYLAQNLWLFTEKVHGTNIRVMWDGEKVRVGGRTDNAQIPVFLLDKLAEILPPERFTQYSDPMCLYGEGYGAKIQKGGGNYIPDGVDFILFDVRVGDWWLKQEDVCDVASKLCLMKAPTICKGTLARGVQIVKHGLKSVWGDFTAEGLVGRPTLDLQTRSGQRIITKLKDADFA